MELNHLIIIYNEVGITFNITTECSFNLKHLNIKVHIYRDVNHITF